MSEDLQISAMSKIYNMSEMVSIIGINNLILHTKAFERLK